MAEMREDPRFPGVLIHVSSYVDDGAVIGRGTKIWHFCHILAGTVIGGGEEARLPMPVEWLYVLEDGTLGVLDEGNRFVANGGGGSRASEENRIVGRVAYWTDDEGCKVNVNTASEGIPWDTPRCVSRKDVAYGEKQPVRNEVQRWPGHPASHR